MSRKGEEIPRKIPRRSSRRVHSGKVLPVRETESGGSSQKRKQKILTSEQLEEFEHLSGNVYVNLHNRLSEHSNVYLGKITYKSHPEETVAVKILAINTKDDAEKLLKESKAIQSINHENVIKFRDAGFSDGTIRCFYLAMELCEQMTLHDYVIHLRDTMKCFDQQDCMSIAKQLASALEAVHSFGILHRDIKPSNVLFAAQKKVLKLTDFSLEKPKAIRSVTVASNKRIGTDGWRAPESLDRNEYGAASDVFSLGLVFYYVWSNGDHAFGADPDLINYNVKKGRNRNLTKIHFTPSQEALDLLETMLEYDYRKRPTASEVASDRLCMNAKSELEKPDGCPIPKQQVPQKGSVKVVEDINGQCIVVFDRNSSMMHAFFPTQKAWRHMQRMCEDMLAQHMTAVVLREHIYTLLQNRKVFRIKFNNPNACWEPQNDMHADHGALPSAAVLGDRIYVIGGSQWGTKVINEGEVYDPTTEIWSRIPDMNMERKVHTVVACKGCVYSIGGWDKDEKLPGELKEAAVAKGEKFDPAVGERGEWSDIAPMHKIRYATAGVSHEGKIYIMGGWREGNRLTEAECYDPVANTWTVLQNMKIGRCFFSAVSVEKKIYAINGDDGFPQTIEEYDPHKDRWKGVGKMENMQIWCKGTLGVTLA